MRAKYKNIKTIMLNDRENYSKRKRLSFNAETCKMLEQHF